MHCVGCAAPRGRRVSAGPAPRSARWEPTSHSSIEQPAPSCPGAAASAPRARCCTCCRCSPPAAAGGAALPIILMATGLGLIVSAVWAAALGQTLVACIFGLFAGFWWSYAVLVLGLDHNWFAIPPGDVTHTIALFQITWAVVFGVLALATLRLPLAFTAVVVLVVVALVLLVIGTLHTDATLTKAAG